jgi:hypothetical protein
MDVELVAEFKLLFKGFAFQTFPDLSAAGLNLLQGSTGPGL